MTSTDELAVRAALADLVQDQPDLPVDRFEGVRRRHQHRRRAQATVAAACAVLAVIGVGVGAGLHRGGRAIAPTHREVPSWALPWPEHRSAAVPQSVLDDAVTAWRTKTYGDPTLAFYAPRQVIWYVAEPGAQRNQDVVVFEVERDDGDHRLVAGVLNDASAAHDADNWRLFDVAAPNPRSRSVVVSFYVPAFSPDDTASNAFLVLTDPKWRTVSPSDPYRTGPPPRAKLDNGFAVIPYGPLRTQLHLALSAGKAPDVPVGIVGLAGEPDSQVPDLALPAELVGVPASRMLSSSSGAGDSMSFDETGARSGPTTIYARCYGGPSITVTLDSQTRLAVRIPCDDEQHVVAGPAQLLRGDTTFESGGVGPGHSTEINASKLTAWRVSVVRR